MPKTLIGELFDHALKSLADTVADATAMGKFSVCLTVQWAAVNVHAMSQVGRFVITCKHHRVIVVPIINGKLSTYIASL